MVLLSSQRVFLEGNPYLLAITTVVSLLHSLFDFLAFKNGMYCSNLHRILLYRSKRGFSLSVSLSLCLFCFNACRYSVLEQEQVYGGAIGKISCVEFHMPGDNIPLSA